MNDLSSDRVMNGLQKLLEQNPFSQNPHLKQECVAYALALEDVLFMVSKEILGHNWPNETKAEVDAFIAKLNANRKIRRACGLPPFNSASLVK